MGVDAMEITIYAKKALFFTIGTCYRSARTHPILLGFGFLLLLMYVYFPALFSFLLSSSPVIVCTATLLGTLLSFGNPNIPEIDREEEEEEEEQFGESEKTHHGVSSLKTGFQKGDLIVEETQRISPENSVQGTEEERKLGFLRKPHEGGFDGSSGSVSIGGVHDPNQVIEAEIEPRNRGFVEMEGVDDDGDGGKGVIKEGRELEEDQGFVDLIGLREREAPSTEENRGDDEDRKDRKGVNVEDEENDNEPFGSIQDFSPWKEMEGHGGGDDESLDSNSNSDSDSDGAESSSPDASMADIIPMLDELHPLLDAGTAQPTFIPLNDSDAASQRSHGSNEHREEEEDEDDDEEEEAQRGMENAEAKPVVHWTEDDERNLMDLGNSELERNRRLESLIARRRARKKFGAMLAERSLIDFDGGELPFPIAPISTARRNPFDIHYDSNEAMGLPPIPGSAPSVLLPRRNPFDLPYDPLEERPDLTGGSFEEEFLTSHEKDAFFRRHESFSLGSSSFFGESKQEKQRSKFRPYFVAEHSDREGFPMFQRQLSGRSDSRVSSIAETESLSSVAEQDHDHKSLNEQELSQEDKPMHPINELSERVSYPMFQRQLSEISDSKVSSVAESESHSLVAEEVDHKSSNEHELSRVDKQLPDDDLISSGNKSVDGEDAYERHPNLLDVEPELARDYLEAEVSEKQHIRSSSSSSSEETEKIFHVNVDEANQDPANDENEVHSNSSTGSSAVDSDHAERVVNLDDNQPKEPVYDWSPVEKSLSGISIIQEALYVDKGVLTSTSSVESDKRVDVMQSHLVERTFLPADGDFSLHHDNTADEGTSGLEGSWTASSHMSAVEENEMMSREVTVISEHDVIKIGFSGDVQNSHDPPVQTVPSVVERILSRNDSSTSEMESEDEKTINEEREPQFQQAEASSSLSLKQEMDIGALEYETDEADVKAFIDSGEPSEYLVSNTSDKLPLLFEESTVISSSDEESKEPRSPRETSINDVDVVSEFDEVVVYDHEHENSSDISPSASGPSSSFPQLLVPQPDIEDVLHDAPENETTSPVIKRLDVQHEVISSQLSEEEVDAFKEIKEIDERLLTELDAVSDFHVEERVTNTSRTANDLAVGHVSEADSAENIENASENSVEPQVGVELPLETGAQPLDGIVEEQHPSASGRSTFELHVDMASPSEEIGTASEERSQGVVESSFSHEDRLRKEMEVTYAIVKPLNDGPTQMQPVEELAGIKARCLEVKDFNSRQEPEGEPEKPLIPKLDEVPSVEEAEASSSELKVSNQHSNYIADTLEMPILDARSLEDIDLVFKQVQKGEENEPIHDTLISDTTESDSAYIEHAKQDLIEMEPSAVEERSVEDKQIEGRVTEKLVTLEPIPDAAVVQESKVQSSELRAAERVPDSVDFDPELQLFEARSVEDVNAALSELSEGNDPNKRTRPETMDSIGSGSELRLVEARSLEDINEAFNELHQQGDHEKHGSHSENVENEALLLESQDPHMQEVVVRSIERIDPVLKEASAEEKSVENTLANVNTAIASSETSTPPTQELESAVETKSSVEESVDDRETKGKCEESKPASVETSEDSSSRKTGLKKKKKKKKRSSKSGSSSSSSSSDSD